MTSWMPISLKRIDVINRFHHWLPVHFVNGITRPLIFGFYWHTFYIEVEVKPNGSKREVRQVSRV